MPGYKKYKMSYKRKTTRGKKGPSVGVSVEKKLSGWTFNPPSNPPQIVVAPWRPLRLQFTKINTASAEGTVTIGSLDIGRQVLEQLGLTAANPVTFNYRMKKVFCYNVATPTDPNPKIDMQVAGMTPTTIPIQSTLEEVQYPVICRVQDTGYFNSPAKVGWRFGASDRAVVLNLDTSLDPTLVTSRNLFTVRSFTNESVLDIYVDVDYNLGLSKYPENDPSMK